KDGSWKYDYSVFDKWVQFMLDLGINKMINCYSIIPWNNEIHYQDEASGELVNVEAKAGTPIFEELWTPFLVDFAEHLREKGWLKKTNIAWNDRPREEEAGECLYYRKWHPNWAYLMPIIKKPISVTRTAMILALLLNIRFQKRILKT